MRTVRPVPSALRPSTRASRGSRARRGGAALAAVGLLVLTGCAQPGPGVAADVDGEAITVDQVDDFAELLCGLGGLPGGAEAPTKVARQQALTLLIGNEVALDLTSDVDVDPVAVQQATQQYAQTRAQLPESQQDTFDAFVEDLTVSQVGLIQVGRESLVEGGADPGEVTDQAAFEEGSRLQQEYADDLDIEVSERFGALQPGGSVGNAEGGLSVPVTEVAQDGASDQPTGAGLPSALRCG